MNDIIPFRDISPMWNRMRQFEEEFDNFFKTPFFTTTLETKRALPKINVKERKNEYVVEASVPGYEKKDISLDFKDGCLYLSSEKKDSKLNEGENYIHREISGRAFCRTIPFVKKVDGNKIKAKHADGILSITVPKVEKDEKNDTKKIKIE